jgi:hypothetical protein
MMTIDLLALATDAGIFLVGVFVGLLLATATADFVKRAILDWIDDRANREKWR